MKRWISLLLAVLLCVSMCACGEDTPAQTNPGNDTVGQGSANNTESGNQADPETTQGTDAAPGGDSQGLAFELNADGESYKLVGMGTCTAAVVTIPATYEGKPVTAIDTTALQKNTTITGVVVPDGVTEIPYGAFLGCTALESVELPDSVITIGHLAFQNCTSLKSIVLPANVTKLSATFEGCDALESVVLPENLIKLDERVFHNCPALQSIDIPATVTGIDHEAFAGCDSLTAVNFADRYAGMTMKYDNEWFGLSDAAKMAEILTSDCGWGIYDLRYTDEAGLVYNIRNFEDEDCLGLIAAEDAAITNAVIASEIAGFPLRVVAKDAFDDCTALLSITIPASACFVSNDMLGNCESVQSITFEETSGWTIAYGDAADVSDPAANVTLFNTLRTFLHHETETEE